MDKVRRKMGKRLAHDAPVPDGNGKRPVVMAVPDSSNTAAIGYVSESNKLGRRCKLDIGLIRNHYVGRTFISPGQTSREQKVRTKFNPVAGVLKDRVVVMVDDSIVRGTTAKQLVQMVRDAGAAEVHFRSASPPVRWPCFYGMDFPSREELAANAFPSVDAIAEWLGVDSLGYLSVEGMLGAVEAGARRPRPLLPRLLLGQLPSRRRRGGHQGGLRRLARQLFRSHALMPILLFDIDGTLYDGHGVGRRAIEATLTARLGRPVDTSSVSFSGKTDPQIFRAILSDTALVGEIDAEAVLADALSDYRTDMLTRLPGSRATAIAGAHDAVRRFADAGVPVGLLTGNLEPLAYLKVEAVGLERGLFPFGAYGSDDEHRNALPAIAAARAAARLGRDVPHHELIVIGDTPLDVACARAVGARAVAVTTGRYSAGDLSDADLVLDSLDDLTVDGVNGLVG